MFLCFGGLKPNNEFELKSRNIFIGLRPNIGIIIEIIEKFGINSEFISIVNFQ